MSPPVRRSRTSDEVSAAAESLLSEGALTENAWRGPQARGGGRDPGFSRRLLPWRPRSTTVHVVRERISRWALMAAVTEPARRRGRG